MDSPVIEDRHYHRSEFLQSVPPNSVEQFRPGHVTHADAFDFLLLFRRKIEGVTQKDIGVPPVTWIAGKNRIESLGKPNFLHQQKSVFIRRYLNILAKLESGN